MRSRPALIVFESDLVAARCTFRDVNKGHVLAEWTRMPETKLLERIFRGLVPVGDQPPASVKGGRIMAIQCLQSQNHHSLGQLCGSSGILSIGSAVRTIILGPTCSGPTWSVSISLRPNAEYQSNAHRQDCATGRKSSVLRFAPISLCREHARGQPDVHLALCSYFPARPEAQSTCSSYRPHPSHDTLLRRRCASRKRHPRRLREKS
jgi:hypothetical protein